MPKVTLANKTELDVLWCGAVGGVLTMETMERMTLEDGLALFGKHENVETIRCDYGSEIVEVLDGYRNLVRMQIDLESGCLTVSLALDRRMPKGDETE